MKNLIYIKYVNLVNFLKLFYTLKLIIEVNIENYY